MTNALGDLAEKTEGDRAEREKRAGLAQEKPKQPMPRWLCSLVLSGALISTTTLFAAPILIVLQLEGAVHFLLPTQFSELFLMAGVLLIAIPAALIWWLNRYLPFAACTLLLSRSQSTTPEQVKPPRAAPKPRPSETPMGRFFSYGIALPVLFSAAVTGGLDLLGIAADLAIGRPMSIIVTVSDPLPHRIRGGCAGEIDLDDYTWEHLCGQPDSLRNALHPGDKLRVSGTGTAWGLFYDKVTPVHG